MRNQLARSITLALAGVLVAAACGGGAGGGATATSGGSASAAAAVPPTKPVEFIISTAPGGGSDIYARKMQSIIDALKLSPQPVTPVNKEGGSGAVADGQERQLRTGETFLDDDRATGLTERPPGQLLPDVVDRFVE